MRTPTVAAYPDLRPSPRWRLARPQEAGLLVVILVIGAALTLLSEPILQQGRPVNNFLRVDNLIPNVLTPMSWMAVMAVGATFVIISGGIDISVGSIFGLAALGTCEALERLSPSASAWIVLPLGIGVPVAIGLLCGLVNGMLVVGLRMHPFIVTLGTLSIFRGIALVAPETKSLPSFGKVLPDAFTDRFMMYTVHYGRADLQPVPMLIMIGCLIVAGVYLQYTVGGRQVYAVGGNEEAARFSGLPVRRVKLRV